ncbi:MAG: ABC transporter substrate-binding protein [Boseongicola sp. SB0673_bin_14]|nr:ABC transporter substrate-binding protein [Chloroflexota bacterium]MYI70129.1 ABC transporter substrate-binding protein [Boseongicola sp. SB0673_bin_14]
MFKLVRIVSLISFLGAWVASAQAPLVQERVLLTFIPNVQFAPFYVGIEDGFFAEAGFDVTLEHLQEPEVLDLVAVGQANFGIVSGEQVILARSRGRDVIYIFEWFQQYPVALVYSDALDLSDLRQLRGLKVGIPGRFGASYSGLTTLLSSAGLSETDIEVNEIGFNAAEVFCLGAVDAAMVYANNEPLQIRSRAQAGDCGPISDVEVITVASQVDLVSNGLIVSRDLLNTAPDNARRMARALQAALRLSINNPAQAYLASLAYVDTLPRDAALITELQAAAARQTEFLALEPGREAVAESRAELLRQLSAQFDPGVLTQFQVLLNTIELWDADQLGRSDLASWEAMRDTLALLGFLGDELGDLSDAFSNDYVMVRNA